MRKDENGYIVVETVGTFIPFVLLVISILSLVNIVSLQAHIHFALTQTAKTMSMYSYVLHVTGVADSLMELDKKATATEEKIEDVLKGIETFTEIEDINIIRNKIATLSAYELFMKYLKTVAISDEEDSESIPVMSDEEYLDSINVSQLRFRDSVLIDKNGKIKLTVEYEVNYTFGAFKMPFGPTLKITQTVVTNAWLDGSGEGYRR
ncbi:MAG: hypothetical protein LBC73_06445 [Oscillospiraceae bacterium]|jgi:hypothetical protein|nr:hypothetical protein [Oscillospiraceae bacterium]